MFFLKQCLVFAQSKTKNKLAKLPKQKSITTWLTISEDTPTKTIFFQIQDGNV